MKVRTVLFALLFACAAVAAPVPVAVAAAADLRGALEELKAEFEAGQPGIQLQLSYGASGSLTAQIQQGAPFDVFLSADTGFPEQLQKAGLAGAQDLFPYATGSLVIWVAKAQGLESSRDPWQVLQQPGIQKSALANPQLAPSGRAAAAARRHAGRWLLNGAAEAGLVSFAQADQPALRRAGSFWRVPVDAYPAIRQAGVILQRSPCPAEARAFRAYLTGTAGQAILARHGYGKP